MNDGRLKVEYQDLRDAEYRAAPDFRRLTTKPERQRTEDFFPRARMITAAAAMLLAVIVITLVSVRDDASQEVDWAASPFLDESTRLTALEMPTDFLLDSHWSEVELSAPEFDFEIQQLEFPEDTSDAN